MTQEAIAAIRQAEEQAEVLCRVAEEKATEMKNKIRQEGEAHCKSVEKETAAEYAEELEDITARAKRLTAKKLQDAEDEAEQLAESARAHIDEAVKLIIWGIVEKCQ